MAKMRSCRINLGLLLLLVLFFHQTTTIDCKVRFIRRLSSQPQGFKIGLKRVILSIVLGILTGLIGALLFALLIKTLANENQLLGSSSNGKYYKTALDNGLTVAVKVLEPFVIGSPKTPTKSVKRRIQHELEVFFGYDYMPMGSLEDAMNGVRENHLQLRWDVRLRIAVGVIKGLQYLHFTCDPQILHYNLKPTNVMLDAEYEPRLADCGLAKLMANIDRATSGYCAPECVQNCRYSKYSMFKLNAYDLYLVSGNR
ncbi:Light-regulated protein precursor, putative isoform 1 [Hibiscus syriacus]|uniref:Light-regulated protein, putative isoform 1 n=1 Tax=Hibiscus syriacus TaxID=106335 RepID=A0A6A2ZNS0_HIBSY|nr:Light-regulated protein precursor, putative isoform 1 [Hibiscus syriacus]